MLKMKDDSKPWKGICCSRCFNAKSEKKKCKCRCHGGHHGQGYKGNIDPLYEKLLPASDAQKFRAQFTRTTCVCGNEIDNEPILYYVPHPDGWKIPSETDKVWLYIKCPKCGHDMSLWKMGVARE